ncbi:DedA family protein [Ilumatobacter nonamiensis]|uniref:DedA family protein n=1 Tax=Ilumatobacter nonamiensis TaxID=467093 RepID=UPI000349EE37|nr:VTT domain-containing protein [Ilumatobacter nonamiensis]
MRLPSFRVLLWSALGILALLWVAPTITAVVSSIDLAGVEHLYAIIAGFVILDAVIPIFPSESLLTTASNLAAQSGSDIQLWKLIAAGTAGAIIGDSVLYWLSRTVLRNRMSVQVEKAQQNEKVARAMAVLSGTAGMLIVFGRFVPGLRFMIGATMGLTEFPYPKFLMWDSIGGFFWAAYTCIFCYLVASVIEDKPLISIAVSIVVTTGLLGLLYRPIKRQWDASGAELADAESAETAT